PVLQMEAAARLGELHDAFEHRCQRQLREREQHLVLRRAPRGVPADLDRPAHCRAGVTPEPSPPASSHSANERGRSNVSVANSPLSGLTFVIAAPNTEMWAAISALTRGSPKAARRSCHCC